MERYKTGRRMAAQRWEELWGEREEDLDVRGQITGEEETAEEGDVADWGNGERLLSITEDHMVPRQSRLLDLLVQDLWVQHWRRGREGDDAHEEKESETRENKNTTHELPWHDADSTTPQTPSPQQPLPYPTPAYPTHLPYGHHLAYFPLYKPPSGLSPDGADPDHNPFPPSPDPSQAPRRLWASGSLSFSPQYQSDMVLDVRRVFCVEELVGEPRFERGSAGGDMAFVDVRRRYLRETRGVIAEETRTLAFIRGDLGDVATSRRGTLRPTPPPPFQTPILT